MYILKTCFLFSFNLFNSSSIIDVLRLRLCRPIGDISPRSIISSGTFSVNLRRRHHIIRWTMFKQ